MAQFYLEHALAFLNLALAGFVIASVAVRFVYPAVSLEGRAFWLVQSAPLPAAPRVVEQVLERRCRRSPCSAVLLLVLGNRALGVGAVTMVVSVITLLLMTLGIAALGLCLGSIYPQFEYENAAKIPSSFGGVAYMILADPPHRPERRARGLAALGAALRASRPSPALHRRGRRHRDELRGSRRLDLAVFAVATVRGIRALEELRR